MNKKHHHLNEKEKEKYNNLYDALLHQDPKLFDPSCPPSAAANMVYNLGENSATPGGYVVFRSATSTNMEDDWTRVGTLGEALSLVETSERNYFLETLAFDSWGRLIATNHCVPRAPNSDGSLSFNSDRAYDVSFHTWRKI